MSELESTIAALVCRERPGFAAAIRELQRQGAEKSEVVRRVTAQASGFPLTQNSLLIAIDAIWREEE